MTYVIVTDKNTVVGLPARSYVTALNQADRLYGKDVGVWIRNNVRIEQRHQAATDRAAARPAPG